MPDYLVETYRPFGARAAWPHALSGARWLRSICVPEDETCFHVLSGPSLDAVRAALERASVAYERIVEAVTTEAGPDD